MEAHDLYTVEMYGWSITIARCPCTAPFTAEMCGEKISASTSSGNEIAGLLKRKDDDDVYDDTKNCEIACQTGGR